jgi:hypothetical protein
VAREELGVSEARAETADPAVAVELEDTAETVALRQFQAITAALGALALTEAMADWEAMEDMVVPAERAAMAEPVARPAAALSMLAVEWPR